MITFVAIPYQAYQLSHASLVVGLLGIVELVPLLVTALLGGALADTVDRRRLVQVAEASLALASGLLLVNALLPDPKLWVLFVVGAVMAGLDGIQRPPLDALLPRPGRGGVGDRHRGARAGAEPLAGPWSPWPRPARATW
jgi:MFS family permease